MNSRFRHLTAALCMFLPALLLVPVLAHAQASAPADITKTVESFLRAQTPAQNGQVSVDVTLPPKPERFAACRAWQAFLPAGARAWGAVSVGVRCTQNARFSLYVRARIRINGTYLVAARPIGIGQAVSTEDIRIVEGELTAQAPDLLRNQSQAVGLTARVPIAPDRPLLASLLRAEAVIMAGQTVKVVSQGNGFSVSNEGQAITTAVQGQTVQVRLPGGGTVTGIAVGQGVVETPN